MKQGVWGFRWLHILAENSFLHPPCMDPRSTTPLKFQAPCKVIIDWSFRNPVFAICFHMDHLVLQIQEIQNLLPNL